MTQVASQSNRVWSSVEGRARTHSIRRAPSRIVYISSHRTTAAAELAQLGLIVCILQILDGVLTAVGMYHFGTHMEGNAFLRFLMHSLGYIPALVLVKTVAIGVVSGLCIHAWRVQWLNSALRAIIGLYILVAVLPWTYVLASHYAL